MKNPIEVIPFLLTITVFFLSECESTFPAKRQVSLWNGATGFCLTQKQNVDWNSNGPTVEDCNPYEFQVAEAPNHVWQWNLIPAESYYNNAFMIIQMESMKIIQTGVYNPIACLLQQVDCIYMVVVILVLIDGL